MYSVVAQKGERAVAAEDVKRDKAIARVGEGIRKKLRAKNGQTVREIKGHFSSDDRKFVWDALELLQRVGDVELQQIEYQGNPGHVAHLKEGR